MADLPARITETEARALWQRAMELQLAAEREAAGADPAARLPGGGLSLEQITHAAEGAGIDPAYLRVAIAEQRLADADEASRDRWTARWARRLLAGVEAIEVAASIPAPPDRTVRAFQTVVSRPAFHMVLEDRVGPYPPLDGVFVYRIDPASGIASSFHGAMQVSDARVVLVTARAEGGATLLRLRLPQYEHGLNLALTGALAGGVGTAGGMGGAAAGGALAGLLGTASALVVAGPAGAGALAGAALAVAGARGVARWGRGKGRAELRRLLQAVAMEAEGGGG